MAAPKAVVNKEPKRFRIQARTGLRGPGQNKSFRYGEDAPPAKKEKAFADVQAWVKQRWREQGLPVKEPFFRTASAMAS